MYFALQLYKFMSKILQLFYKLMSLHTSLHVCLSVCLCAVTCCWMDRFLLKLGV